ncbi:hypothetical protein ABZW30_21655 [Kitasatospora sp. NPDC004669]|uniref:hypothetical protein n=1 Tax=Kitasatospora sp. NPDC004669 TaxID=3154555 RepID=UPI0033A729CA
MQWGEAREQPGDDHYLREIAGFLADRRRVLQPAVLWPQDEPPSLRGGFDTHMSLLTAELAIRLDRPVHLAQLVAAGTDVGAAAETDSAALIVQGAGAVGVTVSLPCRPMRRQQIRLRTGELLYLPPGTRYTATGTADARYGVLSIPSPR